MRISNNVILTEGLDQEETRYPYYNDNLDLVGYTSELRDRDGKFFAFVDFNVDDDKGRIRECPHCLEYEIHNKLGPKIKISVGYHFYMSLGLVKGIVDECPS